MNRMRPFVLLLCRMHPVRGQSHLARWGRHENRHAGRD
jgi:hypothetical protein